MEDFIEGFGITQNKLAVSIGVPPRRINEIVHGKRGITADTALRLAKYFGTSAEFWINLQSHYELDRAEDLAGEQIAGIAGVFLSIPIVAIVTVIYKHVLAHSGLTGLFAGWIQPRPTLVEAGTITDEAKSE